jgi:predicted deacylase
VSDANEIEIVRVGAGAPELWIVAGVHGDEVEGIACVEDALATIRPARGTLVGVPVAYPAALAAGTRHGPDGLDLNRTYPGRPDGGPTEQVAHALWTALAGHAAALLTLHSWGRMGCVVPYVEHARHDQRGRAFAYSLGLPFAEAWDWPDGLLPQVAMAAGIPAVEIEVGGLGRQTPATAELGVRAVRAAAAWLGLLDGDRPSPPRQVRRHRLTVNMQGRVRQLCQLAEAVEAGAPVCEVRRAAGSVAETLVSPVTGWVAAHDVYGAVSPGDAAAMVFEGVQGNERPIDPTAHSTRSSSSSLRRSRGVSATG